ncbi:PRC-barrel domain-containing protein [Chamaesiphon sp.]|uniref:PRC-barrel domain-containing protein n=1 Tax=Chamaesiphon sp. TaxID=2814140 RepID=UPI003593FFED
MRKGKDLIGKTIIAYDSGEKIAIVKDLIFDQDENCLLGFLIKEAGWFRNARILPLFLVKALGIDAVIVPSKDAISPSVDRANIHKVLQDDNTLDGTRIVTTDGRDLGRLIDFYFDEKTGIVEGYEVSGGIFADAYSGRSFVPATHTLKIGRDVAFVPAETVGLMEEQVGGLKAAIQTANDKIQTTAQSAGAKLQDTAQSANEKLQAAARAANTRVTDAIVDRSAQKAFTLGKVAQHTVNTPNGAQLVLAGETIAPAVADTAESLDILDELYRSAGGSLTIPLRERLDDSVAGLTIDRAQGRRAQRAIYTPEGYIIAAQGQIITPQAIERARATHQESALLEAVGLSPTAAAQSQASNLATVAGTRLKTTTTNASAQIQSDATSLWEKVKATASDIQGRSTHALEEKRIGRALGRPTTRVILDRNDEVILNVAELIGHKAIHSARSAGVLDVLLDSVYTEPPQLSIDELRAPGTGKSAL